MKRRWIKAVLMTIVAVVALVVAAGIWAHQQTQKVPEFYEKAIASSPPAKQLAESSEKLEANVQRLQTEVAQRGTWKAEFEVEQINAWLIDQLPKRFPILRTKGLSDPRVVVHDGSLVAAARFKDHRFDAVLSCELAVQLTDQPNRLAISVRSIRAGALPLPISQFQEKISRITSKTQLNLQWEQQDGGTIALISVPSEYPGHIDQSVIIESISLQDSSLCVSGRTGELKTADYQPQGMVYKIATLPDSNESDDDRPVRTVHTGDSADEPQSL